MLAISIVSIFSGDKDRSSERRNTASTIVHRGSSTDGNALPNPVRKTSMLGPCTSHGPETSEVTHSNIIVTSSPEASQPETGRIHMGLTNFKEKEGVFADLDILLRLIQLHIYKMATMPILCRCSFMSSEIDKSVLCNTREKKNNNNSVETSVSNCVHVYYS